MTRELVVPPRPRQQIREALEWWRENRTKAPRALSEELRRTLKLIRLMPSAGLRLQGRRDDVYRVLLRRVHYALYYRVAPEVITVAEFWHSSRRPPDLG